MSTIPQISIVIPAYNEAEYIKPCLKAVFAQTYTKPFEVILVDNNCTDNTRAIAAAFPLRVVSEKTQGIVAAKQAGCLSAQGNIIAVLDADNQPPPHWLKNIEESLEKAGVSGVTGPYHLPSHAPWWAKLHYQFMFTFIRGYQKLFGVTPHIWGGNVAFYKKDFRSFGGYTKFNFTADEVILRKNLRRFGTVLHLDNLYVNTSTRRLSRGAYHYFVEYLLKGYGLNVLLLPFVSGRTLTPADLRHEVKQS